jgi:dolichyl-phosphate-mannose--protein O-mannosyl transferase
MPQRKRSSADEEFLASLADGSLYSMGAYFSDQHPELVDDVIAQAEGIEERGLRGYAEDTGMSVEEAYETLMTGLAVRYYNAVAG